MLTCHNTFEFFTSVNLNVSMENASEFTYLYQITFPPFFLGMSESDRKINIYVIVIIQAM